MKNRVIAPVLIAFLLVGATCYCAVKYSRSTRIPASDAASVVATAPEEVPPSAETPPTAEAKPIGHAQNLPAETKKTPIQPTVLRTPFDEKKVEAVKEAENEPETTADSRDTTQEANEDIPPAPPAVTSVSAITEPNKALAADELTPPQNIKQIDLTEEIKAEENSVHKASAATDNPEPSLGQPDFQPEEQPKSIEAKATEESPVADAIAPSPPAAEAPPEEKLTELDQITIAPYFGFYSVKTNRASNGQLVQLATGITPGIQLGFSQNWSDGFSTSASLDFRHYTFAEIPGVITSNLSGSTYKGTIGASWKQTNRISLGFYAGIAEDFAISVNSANSIEPVKYARPEAGLNLSIKLLQTNKGFLEATPRVNYAASGKHALDKSKGHLEYGLKLKYEKTASKFFSATGAAIDFSQSNFNSTEGGNTNTALQLNLNFSFGI